MALGEHDGRVLRGLRNTRRRLAGRAETTATEAPADEWMRERLAAWKGRSLSQFQVSSVSLVLVFWELDDDFSAWLYADEFRVDGLPVGPRVRRGSSEAAVALHALLDREVISVEVTGGRLRLSFAEGAEVLVEPRPEEQAWALGFEQGGSITCRPGGALAVRVG